MPHIETSFEAKTGASASSGTSSNSANTTTNQSGGDKKPKANREVATNSNLQKMATDIYNLSIGQIVDVEILDGRSKAKIPVMIRLRTVGISSDGMNDILSMGLSNDSKSMRWMKYKVGAINLYELITNQDIIDRYRRVAFRDKSGFLKKANDRKGKGLRATVLTGEPSIGSISSIAILTSDTRSETERKAFSNFDDYQAREQMFEQSLMMLIVVINDDMETVTIYSRGIEDPQTYSLKDIRKGSKDKDDDMKDMLKTFLAGNIPGRL